MPTVRLRCHGPPLAVLPQYPPCLQGCWLGGGQPPHFYTTLLALASIQFHMLALFRRSPVLQGC